MKFHILCIHMSSRDLDTEPDLRPLLAQCVSELRVIFCFYSASSSLVSKPAQGSHFSKMLGVPLCSNLGWELGLSNYLI